jgi:DNA processing protein
VTYPASLLRLRQAPLKIYVQGSAAILSSRAVGVVGSRSASARALDYAERMAEVLVEVGITVISGGAVGIDAAAHRGALRGGGLTGAVLGSGLDRLYPERNLQLFEQIVRGGGALLTPFPVGAPPRASHFPQRNALIAALSQLVVVVEAGTRSGALNTASWAREIQTPVAALPGSAGCQRLFARGAVPIRDPRDVVELLNGKQRTPPASHTRLMDEELRLLALLKRQPANVDELSQRWGKPVARVAGLLLRLEIEGRVARDGLDRYKLS